MEKKAEDKERLRGNIAEPAEDTAPPVENVVVTEIEGAENEVQTEEGDQAEVELENKTVSEETTTKEEEPSDDDCMETRVTPVGCITLVSE